MSRGNAILLVFSLAILGEKCSYCPYFDPDYEEVILRDEDFDKYCLPIGSNCNYEVGGCCHSLSCRCDPWKKLLLPWKGLTLKVLTVIPDKSYPRLDIDYRIFYLSLYLFVLLCLHEKKICDIKCILK